MALRSLPALLDRLADRLADASGAVERELVEETTTRLRLEEEARRATGAIGCATPDRHSDALHTGTRHRHDILCRFPSVFGDAIRFEATRLRVLEAEEGRPPFKLNQKSRPEKAMREGERTNVTRSCQNLIEWLTHQWPKRGVRALMTPEALATAHLDIQTIFILASTHQHAPSESFEPPCRDGERCKRLAVCRALGILVHGIDSPRKLAIRRLAHTAGIVVAGELRTIAKHLERENPGGRNFLPDLARLTNALTELDEEIRTNCLTAPYDLAQRGQRPRQGVLLDAARYLELGFCDDEIAAFLDDGLVGPPERRVARARQRLDRRVNSGSETWSVKFVDEANAEQIARAQQEPDLIWYEGKPYRRVEPDRLEPA